MIYSTKCPNIFGLTVCGCAVALYARTNMRECAFVCLFARSLVCVGARIHFRIASHYCDIYKIDRCARAGWFKLSDHWNSHNFVLITALNFCMCVFLFSFGTFATYFSSSSFCSRFYSMWLFEENNKNIRILNSVLFCVCVCSCSGFILNYNGDKNDNIDGGGVGGNGGGDGIFEQQQQ